MSENSIPEMFDISEGAQAAAQAAMQMEQLEPPADAVENTDKKGNVYKRWTESVVLEGAWRESTKTGLMSFVVAGKVRAGMPNAHRKFWSRHFISFPVLSGSATDEQKKKYGFMNDKAINALTTLLTAAGLAPKSGGLKAQLLQFLFPPKGTPGHSPLVGKPVIVNFVNQPNTGEGAKTDRQTTGESYLPDAPQAE